MKRKSAGGYKARQNITARRRLPMTPYKRRVLPTAQIRRTVMGMAERKRVSNYVQHYILNHDAGAGVVVGANARPNARVGTNWLATVQGDAKFNREGDAIFSKYVDYVVHVSAIADRLNQVCRVIIYKGNGNLSQETSSSSVADIFITDGGVAGSGNLLTQPVDGQKVTVLKDVVISPPNFPSGNGTAQVGTLDNHYMPIRGRIKTNKKVLYITGSAFPQNTIDRIQIAIIPYLNAQPGTSTLDEIARATVEITHYFVDL